MHHLREDAEDLLVTHLGEDPGAHGQHVDPGEGAPRYVPPEETEGIIYCFGCNALLSK